MELEISRLSCTWPFTPMPTATTRTASPAPASRLSAASQMAQFIANSAVTSDNSGLISRLTQPIIKNYYFTLSNENKSDEQFFSELYRAATKDHI